MTGCSAWEEVVEGHLNSFNPASNRTFFTGEHESLTTHTPFVGSASYLIY